jgi:UDP-N-acetylmuramyl-tripeptide synthetase
MSNHSSGGIKSKVKKFVPKKVLKKGLPVYHLARGHAVAARHGYPMRGLKVIGVTGTNGKTTTVAYIDSILRAADKKTAAYTTVYQRVGDKMQPTTDYTYTIDPVAVYDMYKKARKEKVDYVVQEVTSQALHQHRLVGINYSGTVFTNLTYEHMDYHKTMENYARAKGMLFEGKPYVIVVNNDDEWGRTYFSKYPAGRRKILYGQSDEGNAQLKNIKLGLKGSTAIIEIDYETIQIATKLPGEYNVYNAAGAALVCYGLGIPIAAIEKGIRDLTSLPGRMVSIEEKQSFAVFSDYAHTPDGIEQALKTLKAVTKGKLTIVQSAFDGRDPNKWPLLGDASAKYADKIFVTDEEAATRPRSDMRASIIGAARKRNSEIEIREIDDRYTAILEACAEAEPHDTVLIVPQGHLDTREFYGYIYKGTDADLARQALRFLREHKKLKK